MSIAEKLTQVAKNEKKVYDAGYAKGAIEGGYDAGVADGRQAERTAFWDVYLSEGSLKRASYLFSEPRFGSANFYPTRDIRPVGRAQNLFYNFGAEVNGVKEEGFDLRERLNECGVSLDFSQATNLVNCFAFSRFTGLPAMDFTGCGSETQGVFDSAYRLIEIDSITVDADNVFYAWFTNCSELREVRIYGIIAHDIDLRWSKKLSKESIVTLAYIANNSQQYINDFTITLSLVAVNKAFETSAGANDGSTSDDWLGWFDYAHTRFTLV